MELQFNFLGVLIIVFNFLTIPLILIIIERKFNLYSFIVTLLSWLVKSFMLFFILKGGNIIFDKYKEFGNVVEGFTKMLDISTIFNGFETVLTAEKISYIYSWSILILVTCIVGIFFKVTKAANNKLLKIFIAFALFYLLSIILETMAFKFVGEPTLEWISPLWFYPDRAFVISARFFSEYCVIVNLTTLFLYLVISTPILKKRNLFEELFKEKIPKD